MISEAHRAAKKRYLRSAKGRERTRDYNRAYFNTSEGRAVQRASNRKYRQGNPVKIKARNDSSYAVRSGRITRQPCSVCGDPESEKHHPDYDNPLEVVWLCRCHHMEEHING